MFKFKLVKAIVLLLMVMICVSGYFYYKFTKSFDYNHNIKTYKELLTKDPQNCFYMQQIAANFSFLNNFDEAIKYYNDVIKECPDDYLSLFQLGICHYIKGNKSSGLNYMDMSIRKAEIHGERDIALMYQKEKSDWISGDKDLEKYRVELQNKKPSFWGFIKMIVRNLVR